MMKHEPMKDHAERKRLLALIERCEKEQTMSDLIERADAIKAINCWLECNSLPQVGAGILHGIPSADRPQGHWTKTDVATYRCSECGKKQIADDINELNFCCCCGSRNKVCKLKGADDEID